MFRVLKKINVLLDRSQKFKMVLIGVMMIFGAVLETLGVGIILPIVSVITTPEVILENQIIGSIYKMLKLDSAQAFIMVLILFLIFIYIMKNLFLFVEYRIQYRFIAKNRFYTQRRLLDRYLKRPYEYFMNVDSGEVMRTIITDTEGVFLLLSTLLNFTTELVICTALILTIIITDPIMAVLITVILGSAVFIIRKLIEPVLRSTGKKRQENIGKMNQCLLQSIGGIKELKVGRKENYFLGQFLKYGRATIKAESTYNVLGNVPRLSIETLGMTTILGVILFLMVQGREINTMLPQLSVFAMAAVRLMPSINRISASLNAVSYQEPALDKLLEHLSDMNEWENESKSEPEQKEEAQKNLTMKQKIELKGVTYAYPNAENPVLKKADMEIPIGKSIGIIGASGAGKTTVADILLGLLSPQEGAVLSDGRDINHHMSDWLSGIGYIPQMIFLLNDTILANVAFGIPEEEVIEEQVWEALKEAQLADFVENLPKGLYSRVGERGVRLSGGQRQRIGIARALYRNPELLIFDEATSALDHETEAAVMESINNLNGKKTMVIIAHRLTTIEACNIVYKVQDGNIYKEYPQCTKGYEKGEGSLI